MFDPPVSEQNIDPVPRSTRSKDHHEDHHTYDHVHDPGVSSVSIVCEGNLDLEKANIWLGTLLLEGSEELKLLSRWTTNLKFPPSVYLQLLFRINLLLQRNSKGNTSFKEKPEIMLSNGENIGLNCNFQFFTLLVVKIRGMAINIIFGVFQASKSQTG
ncbi:unnamed protein product [Malus baccata var. baccata]